MKWTGVLVAAGVLAVLALKKPKGQSLGEDTVQNANEQHKKLRGLAESGQITPGEFRKLEKEYSDIFTQGNAAAEGVDFLNQFGRATGFTRQRPTLVRRQGIDESMSSFAARFNREIGPAIREKIEGEGGISQISLRGAEKWEQRQAEIARGERHAAPDVIPSDDYGRFQRVLVIARKSARPGVPELQGLSKANNALYEDLKHEIDLIGSSLRQAARQKWKVAGGSAAAFAEERMRINELEKSVRDEARKIIIDVQGG